MDSAAVGALPPGFTLDTGNGPPPPPPGFKLDTAQAPVDESKGAGFMERLGGSFKSSPEGKSNYYKSIYGEKNVRTAENGDIQFFNPKTKAWHPIDEKGLSWADIADFAGDIPEMLGMGAGGVLGSVGGLPGAMGGAGAGGAAGNAVKQAIGALLPGAENMSVGDRAKEMAVTGALGAAGEGVLAGAKALLPKNLVAKWLGKQIEKQGEGNFARESARLQTDAISPPLADGIKLRASQESMNPDLALMEGFAERNPFGKTIFKKAEIANQNAAKARLDRLLSEAGGELDKPGLGQSIADSAGVVMKDLLDARKRAGSYFSQIDEQLGGNVIFPLNNFQDYLRSTAQKYMAEGMSKDAQAYGAALLKEADQFPKGMASARGLQDALEKYGAISYGKEGAKLFQNLDNAAERRVAKNAFKALQKDLDDAANSAGMQANGAYPMKAGTAKLLKAARDGYRDATKAIDSFEETTIARYLDRAGTSYTDVAEWLLEQNPETITNTLKVLGRANPEVQNDVVRNVLSNSIKAGIVDRPVPFDRKLALDALPKDQAARDALFGGHISEKQITDIYKLIERSNWTPAGQGIPSSPLGTLISAAQQLLQGNGTHMGVHVLAPRLIAEWATDPTKRAAFKAVVEGHGAVQKRGMDYLMNNFKKELASQAAPVGGFELANTIRQNDNQRKSGMPQ